jgi:hypothetical protein
VSCLVCVAIERTEATKVMGHLSIVDVCGVACCVMAYVMARGIRDREHHQACDKHDTMIRMLDEPGGPFRAKDGTEREL